MEKKILARQFRVAVRIWRSRGLQSTRAREDRGVIIVIIIYSLEKPVCPVGHTPCHPHCTPPHVRMRAPPLPRQRREGQSLFFVVFVAQSPWALAWCVWRYLR